MANISKKVTLTAVQQMEDDQIIRDTELKGFGVRKRKGRPSYFLQTRVNGRQRWITIGVHGAPWTPASARKEALRILSETKTGVDHNEERKRNRSIPLIKDAAVLFLEEHGAKVSQITLRDYKRLVRDYILPSFGNYKVDELNKAAVSKAHTKWGERQRNANHALSVLSKFMSWAEEEGFRQGQTNPCKGVKRYRENKRERYLSREEFDRLGNVLSEAEATGAENLYAIAAIRLLILTGARVSEILTLTWEEVDLERGLLLLKTSKTGQKPIYLNKASVMILDSLPRLSKNPYVIIGSKPATHLASLRKHWVRICREAKLNDVRLHDLRHSFASLAASGGASLPIIGRLLGHTQPQTTARYAHLANDPLREVNEMVGEQLSGVLGLGDK